MEQPELVQLIERLRIAFLLLGLEVEVREAAPAPSASSDGARRAEIVLVTSRLSELGRALVNDADVHVKRLLARFQDDRPAPLPVVARGRDQVLAAAIDADLPAKAFLRLQGPLPAAPSGRIVYNRQSGQWQDASQAALSMGG